VGNDQRGPSGHEIVQGALDLDLGLRVQGGSGLVQDQDRGVLQKGTGNGDPLPFPAGKFCSPMTVS
jgi:hypothetical protein